MVSVKLIGGLGNQMFQFAYGINLSLKFNTKLYLDTSFYNYQGDLKREFLLNKFNYPLNMNLLEIQHLPFIRLIDNFEYYDIKDDNYYLDGYWQSEKFFGNYSHIIRDIYYPSENIINKLYTKYSELKLNSASLHIRRTDYLNSQNIHPVQSINYYEDAINIIGDYDYLFIISDDINWCEQNLKFNNMIFVRNQEDIDDLYLMSLCKNNIIANSSFSWWGAWLNKHEDKKIIAPKKWFGKDFRYKTDNIIPQKWIQI